ADPWWPRLGCGSHQGKKSKTRTEEKFARKFPYRFSWLTETNAEPLQPWEVTKMSSSLREQLPLQKTLVPTRSIPVRGTCKPKDAQTHPLTLNQDWHSGVRHRRASRCPPGPQPQAHSPRLCQQRDVSGHAGPQSRGRCLF
uniref:Uncharacterized protein n=1 Tax=Balaenoptera musculus TaxID=9771 RepID=A0A8C0CWS0_BALMU